MTIAGSVIYALIADESTDVTNKEQISICIRFVGRKEDGKHRVREEFLTFVHVDIRTNAEELTTKFLETIQSVGLSVNDMRTQRYDGASVMSGHVSGVQTQIRQVNPNAVYIHFIKPLYCLSIKASTCEKHHGYHARSYVGL